jgi:hypothetical protein
MGASRITRAGGTRTLTRARTCRKHWKALTIPSDTVHACDQLLSKSVRRLRFYSCIVARRDLV